MIADPNPVAPSLCHLRNLQDGWLDGHGRAPNPVGLDWLTNLFNQQYSDDLVLPCLYPTPEGGVQAEWSLPPHDISLDNDLSSHRGEWHRLNLLTDEEETRTLELDNAGEWEWLSESIRRLPRGSV